MKKVTPLEALELLKAAPSGGTVETLESRKNSDSSQEPRCATITLSVPQASLAEAEAVASLLSHVGIRKRSDVIRLAIARGLQVIQEEHRSDHLEDEESPIAPVSPSPTSSSSADSVLLARGELDLLIWVDGRRREGLSTSVVDIYTKWAVATRCNLDAASKFRDQLLTRDLIRCERSRRVAVTAAGAQLIQQMKSNGESEVPFKNAAKAAGVSYQKFYADAMRGVIRVYEQGRCVRFCKQKDVEAYAAWVRSGSPEPAPVSLFLLDSERGDYEAVRALIIAQPLGSTILARHISDRLGMTISRVSRFLHLLVEDGYVTSTGPGTRYPVVRTNKE